MTVNLHWHKDISDEARYYVQKGIDRGVMAASLQHMNPRNLDVVVTLNPKFVIPEWGIGGGVLGPDRFALTLDPQRVDEKGFASNVARLVAHEITHIERERRGHRVVTLRDALVSEGLAQITETRAGFPTAFYSSFDSVEDRERFTARARTNLDLPMKLGEKESPYNQWFFGVKGDPNMPRFGGYALGYDIVREFLVEHRLNPVGALTIRSEDIAESWEKGSPQPLRMSLQRPPLRASRTPI